MTQVVLIHGGDSFSSYDAYIASLKNQVIEYARLKPQRKWKTWLAEQLPAADILYPTFPNGYNAVYDEWVIYFEKLIPFFTSDTRLVGHSLGAMFLAKYLHETPLPTKVRQIILIAGQYGTRANDDLGSFVVTSATGIEKSTREVHLFFSEDDQVIDYTSLAQFQKDIPSAITHSFTNRGHFLQETFPELLALLQK